MFVILVDVLWAQHAAKIYRSGFLKNGLGIYFSMFYRIRALNIFLYNFRNINCIAYSSTVLDNGTQNKRPKRRRKNKIWHIGQ